ncbi:DsbE family thiol:disulfide interchange protein [Methyloligella solikamskensis]|uniref:DsbE family thiol:disulfide interchange protein n=1 Tax=Methyloligella solikamskensis TaxID=1177756 RepID=A0ABW3J6E8_9HYPH
MTEQDGSPRRRALIWSLPLIVFLGLAALFWFALGAGDPHRLPSVLLGKPVPVFDLPPLIEGGEGFDNEDLAEDGPTIVNVWASWCGPCRQEHPVLMELAKEPGVRLFGINYKDDPESARAFLAKLGNPFERVGADRSGRTAIDWGVYGVPETYVIDAEGNMAYRHVGPLTEKSVKEELLPLIAEKGMKTSGSGGASGEDTAGGS